MTKFLTVGRVHDTIWATKPFCDSSKWKRTLMIGSILALLVTYKLCQAHSRRSLTPVSVTCHPTMQKPHRLLSYVPRISTPEATMHTRNRGNAPCRKGAAHNALDASFEDNFKCGISVSNSLDPRPQENPSVTSRDRWIISCYRDSSWVALEPEFWPKAPSYGNQRYKHLQGPIPRHQVFRSHVEFNIALY